MTDPNLWTGEKVIDWMKKLQSDVDLSADHIARVDPSLFEAASVYYSSWSNALEVAGLAYVPEPLNI